MNELDLPIPTVGFGGLFNAFFEASAVGNRAVEIPDDLLGLAEMISYQTQSWVGFFDGAECAVEAGDVAASAVLAKEDDAFRERGFDGDEEIKGKGGGVREKRPCGFSKIARMLDESGSGAAG